MSPLIIHRIGFIMLILSACAGLPTETQTGRTAVVRITDNEVSPRDITVQPGDAVQLLNGRDRPVWIYLGRDRPKELSCQRGFSFFWGVEEVAKVPPGASASVCFSSPGEYGYWVQSGPSVQGGAPLGEIDMPVSLPAAIIVEGIRQPPPDR
jgi:plastocyanin